mgnify:FL=1
MFIAVQGAHSSKIMQMYKTGILNILNFDYEDQVSHAPA